MKWISVEEYMPIQESEVDVYKTFDVIASDGEYVFSTFVSAGMKPSFWVQFEHEQSRVTHWMPMPDKP